MFPLKTVFHGQYITQWQRNFITNIESNNVILKDRNYFGNVHWKVTYILKNFHACISSLFTKVTGFLIFFFFVIEQMSLSSEYLCFEANVDTNYLLSTYSDLFIGG